MSDHELIATINKTVIIKDGDTLLADPTVMAAAREICDGAPILDHILQSFGVPKEALTGGNYSGAEVMADAYAAECKKMIETMHSLESRYPRLRISRIDPKAGKYSVSPYLLLVALQEVGEGPQRSATH
jgi:hypothetical protein